MTATSPRVVRHAVADGVAIISLDRPKVNAYEIELMSQLREAVRRANEDEDVGAVVLRSSLSTVFCVGADIKAWAANDVATNQRLVDMARATTAAMEGSPKVFIAAINAHALGGGLELALACDLRFAAAGEYLLGLPEVKLGLMPGNGGTQRLLRRVGLARAFELVGTGEGIDPAQALAIGLVDRLVTAERLDEETETFARSLAAGPREALAAIKATLRDSMALPLEAGLELEVRTADALYQTPDAIEGFRAYVEKRPPRFGGNDVTS